MHCSCTSLMYGKYTLFYESPNNLELCACANSAYQATPWEGRGLGTRLTQWGYREGEGRTSSTKHVKKLHSRYVESLQGFTEIKQVSACSIQVCRGSMGFNAWNTFVLHVRVEHPLHWQKVGENPGYGWAHLPCWENCMLTIAAGKQSTCVA